MSTSARERGEAEARRLIAIIDGTHPSPRERYRDLKAEAGRSGILASKALLAGHADAAIEQATTSSLLADTSYTAAREIRHSAGQDGALSPAPIPLLEADVPRLTP